jgi:peptidoglycan/xylan/chitin deacetylase (PgdA/CDA1 family)
MNAMLSEARAKVGHRLAMHLRVDPFCLRNSTPMVSFTFDDLPKSADRDGIDRAFDEAQTNNGWLIFYGHDVAERPSAYGCSPALLAHALEAASRRNFPVLTMAEAMRCARA